MHTRENIKERKKERKKKKRKEKNKIIKEKNVLLSTFYLLATFYFLRSTFYFLLSTSPSFLLPLLDSTLYSIGVETYLLLLLLLTGNGKWAVWSRPLVKAVGQGRLVTE